MSIKHLFSVDPGDRHNGFCYFKYDTDKKTADLRIMEVLTSKGLTEHLQIVWGVREAVADADITFVVENFRVDQKVRGVTFQWNEVLTARNIGKVELVADWVNAKCVLQEPSILAMARKWSPFSLPKGHIPDDKSAFLHGAKYMMDAKWIMTTDQILHFGQERL